MASTFSIKRKHHSLSLATKMEIITRLDSGESRNSLAVLYNIGRSTIADIYKKKDAIAEYVSKFNLEEGVKKRKSMKKANDAKLDETVYLWYLNKRCQGKTISHSLLCETALEFNRKLGGLSDFKASSGWLKNFLSRHGIKDFNCQGELYKNDLLRFLRDDGYTSDCIYIADEAQFNWTDLPNKSCFHTCETDSVSCKESNDSLSIITCSNVSKTHALKLLVIGKPTLSVLNINDSSVVYKSQCHEQLDSNIFLDWITDHFIPEVKLYRENLESNPKKDKVMLLFKNNSSCLSDEVFNSNNDNFKVLIFPSNMPNPLEPIDLGITDVLKRLYKKEILQSLLMLDDVNDNNSISLFKRFSIDECYRMLSKAWSIIQLNINSLELLKENTPSSQEFVNAFHSIPTFSNTTKQDINFWLKDVKGKTKHINENKSECNVLNLLSSEPSPASVEIKNIDCKSIVEKDKSTVTESIIKDKRANIDSSQEEIPTDPEVLSALNLVMAWYRNLPECKLSDLLLLKKLRDTAAIRCTPLEPEVKIHLPDR